MRIGFVTQWFPPEPGTGVAADIAAGLAVRGHEVEVLTGLPNYPTGRIQDGYPLRAYQIEQRGRLRVHRCLLYPSHNRSVAQRAANYLSFAASATWAARRVPRPDVWLVYSSPATSALPALLTGRRRRTPVYLIIQDLWPDSVMDSGFLHSRSARMARWLLDRFCTWTYRQAAGIGIISPSMRTLLQDRGVAPPKIHHIPNPMPSVRSERTTAPADLGVLSGRIFMYVGNVGQLQGLEPLLHAFRQVPEATLMIVGDGVDRERLQSLVESWGSVVNIHFLGAQPPEQAQELTASADILVVSLLDTSLLRATMPSKVQAALASGRPILAQAAGDVAALVERERCGWTAAPGDVSGLVTRIRTAAHASPTDLAQRGERGRAFAQRVFAPGAVAKDLETMLIGAVADPARVTGRSGLGGA